MRISTRQLVKLAACPGSAAAFHETFPSGSAAVTVQNARKLWDSLIKRGWFPEDVSSDWGWLVSGTCRQAQFDGFLDVENRFLLCALNRGEQYAAAWGREHLTRALVKALTAAPPLKKPRGRGAAFTVGDYTEAGIPESVFKP